MKKGGRGELELGKGLKLSLWWDSGGGKGYLVAKSNLLPLVLTPVELNSWLADCATYQQSVWFLVPEILGWGYLVLWLNN
jgi:hypothetical protein